MDLQARKIAFVQKFLEVQSEEIVSRLEMVLGNEVDSTAPEQFEPMSIEDFYARIDKSIEDSREGRIIEASELKLRVEKWK